MEPIHAPREAQTALAHSEEYFSAYRDFWWNNDFFELMARRWRLDKYRQVLDVGCGLCHWSRQLLPHLAEHAHITALDRDPKWAAGNAMLADAFARQGARIEFKQGDAHQLPFEDCSFELVSCQTVLIHLADPLAALREMHRVLKPGGLVICAEPCNLAQAGMVNALSAQDDIDERCAQFRYALLCERGKIAAGEGNSSLGDQLAWLFMQAGFKSIHSQLSDKATPLLPAYAGDEAQAMLAESMWIGDPQRTALWDTHVARWIAALDDPTASDFVRTFHRQRTQRFQQIRSMVQAGHYWEGGAAVTYLVSGSK